MASKGAAKVAELATKSAGAVMGFFCICASGPLIIGGTFMGLYLSLTSAASNYNQICEDRGFSSDNAAKCFDACGGDPSSMADEDLTMWTTVYILNACVYTLNTTWVILLIISAFWWPLAFCGACGICCTQLAHFAAVIVTGVFRYSDPGELCAKNKITRIDQNESDSSTMAEVGDMMQGIFISQCVLYCFYGCCLGALVQIAIGLGMLKKSMG